MFRLPLPVSTPSNVPSPNRPVVSLPLVLIVPPPKMLFDLMRLWWRVRNRG